MRSSCVTSTRVRRAMPDARFAMRFLSLRNIATPQAVKLIPMVRKIAAILALRLRSGLCAFPASWPRVVRNLGAPVLRSPIPSRSHRMSVGGALEGHSGNTVISEQPRSDAYTPVRADGAATHSALGIPSVGIIESRHSSKSPSNFISRGRASSEEWAAYAPCALIPLTARGASRPGFSRLVLRFWAGIISRRGAAFVTLRVCAFRNRSPQLRRCDLSHNVMGVWIRRASTFANVARRMRRRFIPLPRPAFCMSRDLRTYRIGNRTWCAIRDFGTHLCLRRLLSVGRRFAIAFISRRVLPRKNIRLSKRLLISRLPGRWGIAIRKTTHLGRVSRGYPRPT